MSKTCAFCGCPDFEPTEDGHIECCACGGPFLAHATVIDHYCQVCGWTKIVRFHYVDHN